MRRPKRLSFPRILGLAPRFVIAGSDEASLCRRSGATIDRLACGISEVSDVSRSSGRLGAWGLYPAIVIMLREILVSGLREFLAGIRVGLPVTRLAKWKTGVQMVALGLLVAGDPAARVLGLGGLPVWLIGIVMLWVSAVLTLVTGWDYLVAGLRHAVTPVDRGSKPETATQRPEIHLS